MDRHAITARLQERTCPLLGQFITVVAIIACLRLAGWARPAEIGLLTGDTVTMLSWLPASLRYDGRLFALLQMLVPIMGLFWLFQVAIPWSSWGMALGYTALIALHEERRADVDHSFMLPNHALLACALWYHLCRREIQASLRAGTFWHAPVCPRWFPLLVAIQIGAFYSWAGCMKLGDAGLGWANGTALQIWAYVWGDPNAPLVQLIQAHRPLAVLLQAAALTGETLALPALLWRPLRWLVGALLVGFHVGQEIVFGWWFGANALLIALIYFPVEQLMARLRRSIPVAPHPMPEYGWRRWIVARTDILGRYRLSVP